MSYERLPWFPFYASDFLSDAHVQAMTLEEVGAYVVLLLISWREHGIPNRPRELSRLLKVSRRRFEKLWPAVEKCFFCDDATGRLMNKRIEQERAKQHRFSQSQSTKARRRWAAH